MRRSKSACPVGLSSSNWIWTLQPLPCNYQHKPDLLTTCSSCQEPRPHKRGSIGGHHLLYSSTHYHHHCYHPPPISSYFLVLMAMGVLGLWNVCDLVDLGINVSATNWTDVLGCSSGFWKEDTHRVCYCKLGLYRKCQQPSDANIGHRYEVCSFVTNQSLDPSLIDLTFTSILFAKCSHGMSSYGHNTGSNPFRRRCSTSLLDSLGSLSWLYSSMMVHSNPLQNAERTSNPHLTGWHAAQSKWGNI